MLRLVLPLIAATAALALAGCNETMGAMAGPVAASPQMARVSGDCTSEIDRFQKIVTSDRDTGNVDPKVYDQIESELARATQACAAGKGGEAHAILSAAKQRHGYRA